MISQTSRAGWPFNTRVGQGCPDAKQMAFGGGDFDAGNDEKIIHRQSVLPHQPFLEQVVDRVAGVVIGDGNPCSPFARARR